MKNKIPRGTMIRVKRGRVGTGRIGISTGNEVDAVLLHSGPFGCLSDEIQVLPEYQFEQITPPMRVALPYGMWTCADGREVLFNRNYDPIWGRRGKGSAFRFVTREFVESIEKEEF
jgi:hypothetical protein